MKVLLFLSLFFLSHHFLTAQETDTNFRKVITAFSWMPDGQSLILNILKLDKSEKLPPSPGKYQFHLNNKKLEKLPIDGSGLVAAPDGKSIAYLKRINNKPAIYLFDLSTGKERALVDDTLGKFSLSWSGDGKWLVYNISIGRGPGSKTEIMVYRLSTGEKKQITQSFPDKSYSPDWNPVNDQIAYYLEKGDGRDQIYLTDKNGSFHRNLTNDTTTLNYYPKWIDQSTIMYTEDPDKQMILRLKENKKEWLTGIKSSDTKYNGKANKVAYIENEVRLVLYDMRTKTNEVVLKIQ